MQHSPAITPELTRCLQILRQELHTFLRAIPDAGRHYKGNQLSFLCHTILPVRDLFGFTFTFLTTGTLQRMYPPGIQHTGEHMGAFFFEDLVRQRQISVSLVRIIDTGTTRKHVADFTRQDFLSLPSDTYFCQSSGKFHAPHSHEQTPRVNHSATKLIMFSICWLSAELL